MRAAPIRGSDFKAYHSVLIIKLPYSRCIFMASRFFARAAVAQLTGAGAGGTATWRGDFAVELLQMAQQAIIGSNHGCSPDVVGVQVPRDSGEDSSIKVKLGLSERWRDRWILARRCFSPTTR